METRANHVLIGAFALGAILVGFLFVLWLSKVQLSAQYAYYDVKFNGSVSGLSVGSEVRYNGVKVGTVTDIRFHPDEPQAVYALIKVEKRNDFTLRQDSKASLQFEGITGLDYVQIAGGTLKSPALATVSDPKGKVPVIVAQQSAIDQLFNSLPELVSKAQTTFDRLNQILDPQNQARIDEILANLSQGSASFADAVKDIHKLSGDADTFINHDARASAQQISQAAKSINDAAELGDEILAENRAALNDFTANGLSQLGTFVVEARQLVATLDRIATEVESDPAGFVLGGSHGKEVEVRK